MKKAINWLLTWMRARREKTMIREDMGYGGPWIEPAVAPEDDHTW
jgi:hypothetical protein